MLLSQLQGFTLTMWDVKKLKIPTQKIPYYPFYLNYVGCKVNSYLEELIRIDLKFYLNYVGCKVKFVRYHKLNHCCFTLTMWDVK